MSNLKLFIIGFITGIIDAVPGVSGATMLLIFGVYEKTVSYASNIIYEQVPSSFYNVFQIGQSKNELEIHKILYISVLLSGTLVGVVFSFVVFDRLLHISPSSVYGIFTGLVLASSYIVVKRNNEIKEDPINIIWVTIGFMISAIIVSLGFTTGNSSLILLTSGFIATFGMLLPGLSGSFLLLILGKYSFVSGLISTLVGNPSMIVSDTGLQLFIMCFGGLFGVLFNLKMVSYLIDSRRITTLSAILGIVLGGLLAPVNQFTTLPDGDVVLFSAFLFASLSITLLVGYLNFEN